MSDWRERAKVIRAGLDRHPVDEAATAARDREREAMLPKQTAFATKIIKEIVVPVLTEFVGIVTGTPGKPVCHEYDKRTYGVTCDLDSLRFWVKAYLLFDSKVRLAVSLTPSQTEGWHRDYGPQARDDEIEEWFGNCLAKLYESR
jgi:hypothetical protein